MRLYEYFAFCTCMISSMALILFPQVHQWPWNSWLCWCIQTRHRTHVPRFEHCKFCLYSVWSSSTFLFTAEHLKKTNFLGVVVGFLLWAANLRWKPSVLRRSHRWRCQRSISALGPRLAQSERVRLAVVMSWMSWVASAPTKKCLKKSCKTTQTLVACHLWIKRGPSRWQLICTGGWFQWCPAALNPRSIEAGHDKKGGQ